MQSQALKCLCPKPAQTCLPPDGGKQEAANCTAHCGFLAGAACAAAAAAARCPPVMRPRYNPNTISLARALLLFACNGHQSCTGGVSFKQRKASTSRQGATNSKGAGSLSSAGTNNRWLYPGANILVCPPTAWRCGRSAAASRQVLPLPQLLLSQSSFLSSAISTPAAPADAPLTCPTSFSGPAAAGVAAPAPPGPVTLAPPAAGLAGEPPRGVRPALEVTSRLMLGSRSRVSVAVKSADAGRCSKLAQHTAACSVPCAGEPPPAHPAPWQGLCGTP